MNKLLALLLMMNLSCLLSTRAQAPMDGGVWKDNTGKHINAHGGNIFNYKGTYYWYGESHSEDGKPYSSLGVSCFTSKDLKNWTNHGLVLPVSEEPGSDIEGGCIIERPEGSLQSENQEIRDVDACGTERQRLRSRTLCDCS